MELEKYKKEIDDYLANMSDEELEKWFPRGPEISELIAELGYVSAHKYLNTENFQRRELIIQELLEGGIIEPIFENPFPGKISTLFDFTGDDAMENYNIFMKAFSAKLTENHTS